MFRKKEENDEPMIFLTLPQQDEFEDFEEGEPAHENEEEGAREVDDRTGFVRVERKDRELAKEVFDWGKHIVIAVLLGLILVIFVVQRNLVVGSSMEPTLHSKDQLLVQKISRLFPEGIGHGDIITINAEGLYGDESEDKNIIKRVVGIPGDNIIIKDGYLWRNGEKIIEDYLEEEGITHAVNTEYSDLYLGDFEYYVLGDNRRSSMDSRRFGPVTKDRILGEVLFRFFPLKDIGVP